MDILDSIDKQLVKLLEENAQQSSNTLSRRIKVSASTVRRRVERLEKTGILHFTAHLDHEKIGFPLSVIIAFDVTHDKLKSAVQKLVSRSEIGWVSTTTGRFDVFALARFRSTGELSEFFDTVLADIDGLRNSETFICLETSQRRNRVK